MKFLRNEVGLSLAELLATLAIASLFVTFIISIHILIQNQYSNQSKDTKYLTDITIAVKVITKDIRSADVIVVGDHENSITIQKNNGDVTTYALENNVLKKNEANYIFEIITFEVVKDGHKIYLEIESESGKKIKTEIVMREVER
ncbi:PilW family protein [Pseudogracilibacillus auburnensis]|uniref:Prepilin-type N-terminal cleavage/methylation domain-containing protein n=1 Tax=Pseudogracilibacillus auburnensis TaxID=1494959 RepID=A0A2V3VTS6_9BACI|nr:hypothetical protein [Pseudogracilibacillus auburnensis]MBO1003383.1 hypothetical protein [Pseudogracilibacillus auburnensis]PXW85313.1 hypothetical protein DFR56_11181 [Pseudogracilibacillus auburnensis]